MSREAKRNRGRVVLPRRGRDIELRSPNRAIKKVLFYKREMIVIQTMGYEAYMYLTGGKKALKEGGE